MIQWAGMEILETLTELVKPEHTGLLLWNFSSESITRCFNGSAIVANTKRMLNNARQSGVRIFHPRQGSMDWASVGPSMLRMRMKQFRISSDQPLLNKSSSKPETFTEELKPQDGDIVFEKFVPNAFLGTCFEWWLRKHNLKTIILAGAFLETGIDGTAREALNHGYYTVIARDCVGSCFEDTHSAALRSLEKIFDIVDSPEIISTWQTDLPSL